MRKRKWNFRGHYNRYRRWPRYGALRVVWHPYFKYTRYSFGRKPNDGYIMAAEYAYQHRLTYASLQGALDSEPGGGTYNLWRHKVNGAKVWAAVEARRVADAAVVQAALDLERADAMLGLA